MALVFQYYSLYPRYTVRQNLAFPLKSKVRSYSAAEIEARIARAAKTLRIEHLLERKTDKLSGGEMQRVSIGRAIVREPRVFLMDEPLSNLDAKLREALRAELKDLQMKLGATFLFVTHDQIEAMSMGDKVGVLNQGRIVQVGTPQQIYNQPRDLFVAGFVGSPAMNLLPGEAATGGSLLCPASSIFRPHVGSRMAGGSSARHVGIRSEDIRVGPAEASRRGPRRGESRRREDRDAPGRRPALQGDRAGDRWTCRSKARCASAGIPKTAFFDGSTGANFWRLASATLPALLGVYLRQTAMDTAEKFFWRLRKKVEKVVGQPQQSAEHSFHSPSPCGSGWGEAEEFPRASGGCV